MQGLNVYTRGAFGRSIYPRTILNKWHIYVYQPAIQPMKAAKSSMLCCKWLWVWMSTIYSTNYYSAVFISCTAVLQKCNSSTVAAEGKIGLQHAVQTRTVSDW